jgi:hypothetical protein
MKRLRYCLVLAALAALAVPTWGGGGGVPVGHRVAVGPDAGPRLVSVGTIVEPIEAEAAGVALLLPTPPPASRIPAAAPYVRTAAFTAPSAPTTVPRTHLLQRVSNPSTAPPRTRA